MDKGDKKKQEEALKSTFMSDRNAAFLDAASLLGNFQKAINVCVNLINVWNIFSSMG